MNLPEFAQLEEDFGNLQAAYADLETELNEARAEIRELKAQLSAKEEGATTHTQIESRDGYVWQRIVTIIAPEWEQLHEVGA